jgi:predicted RNase H-like nuclease (RuvC/YqgF family)
MTTKSTKAIVKEKNRRLEEIEELNKTIDTVGYQNEELRERIAELHRSTNAQTAESNELRETINRLDKLTGELRGDCIALVDALDVFRAFEQYVIEREGAEFTAIVKLRDQQIAHQSIIRDADAVTELMAKHRRGGPMTPGMFVSVPTGEVD